GWCCVPPPSDLRGLVFLGAAGGALNGILAATNIGAADVASAEVIETAEFFLGCRSLGYLAGRFLPDIVCDPHPRFNRFVKIPVVSLPKIPIIVVNKQPCANRGFRRHSRFFLKRRNGFDTPALIPALVRMRQVGFDIERR